MPVGYRFEMVAPAEPLVRREVAEFAALEGEVVVEVAGCGVCHTDLGFLHDGVKPRHALPLALGHEISGRVVAAGRGCEFLAGSAVIVPAVIPCGSCDACTGGFGGICTKQVMPGNDAHGGFASHVVVPARGLCVVPETALAGRPSGFLSELSVIADAVSTPYQAVVRAEIGDGDLAIVVGLGGVGGFAAQIASALGATVVGIDVEPARLEPMRRYGVALAIDSRHRDARDVKKEILGFAKGRGLRDHRWKIFECSGNPRGQETAFGLLVPGAWLGIVGFTREPVSIRLSNVMAFDARVQGNWGCLPERYPAALELVLGGRVHIAPFVERHPMLAVNEVLQMAQAHALKARPILVP